MKRNGGLTLIELVVVIAIMSVLVGVVGISITVVSRQKVSNAAADVRGLLQTAQTIAMSKKNCYVEITKESSGYVFTTYSYTESASTDRRVIDKVTIGDKIVVSIPTGVGNSYAAVNSAVQIKYKRESGAFDTGTPTGIRFSRGNKTVTLSLTALTGRVSFK